MDRNTDAKVSNGEAEKREYQNRKPNHEVRVNLSQDGKYFIFQDITTWILPRNYIAAILKNSGAGKSQESDSADSSGAQSKNEKAR